VSFRSDSELVEACLRGETAAWDALVHRYTRLVWSTCRGENVPHADCEDLHQNVFASLVTRLESIRDRERLSSWLITAARRECWRWKRRRTIAAGRMAPDGDPDDVALPGSDPAAERRQLVREGLERLDERCRTLLVTLFASAGDPSYEHIGRALGMPVGGIGPTRARCLSKLSSILRSLGLGPAARDP
jgi:RNA polymerase sigma factor (sigma-70 family)